MTRETSEIIADLRSEADFNDDGADEYPVKLLREAADRLEKSTTLDSAKFETRYRGQTVNTSFHNGWKSGVATLRNAIADGSIDEMGK